MPANIISGNGSNNVTIGGAQYIASFATNLVPVGSASVWSTFLVNTGSAWTPVDTGSIPNVGTIYLSNPGPGTIQFASASNATASALTITLTPTQFAWFGVTGSNPLYARALDSQSYIIAGVMPR